LCSDGDAYNSTIKDTEQDNKDLKLIYDNIHELKLTKKMKD